MCSQCSARVSGSHPFLTQEKAAKGVPMKATDSSQSVKQDDRSSTSSEPNESTDHPRACDDANPPSSADDAHV